MLQILFAVLAGMLTLAAPCILPLLPILLGASVGQTSKTRPLFIVVGFVLVFTCVSFFISVLVQHAGVNPNVLRLIGVGVLALFGLCMIVPTPFEIVMSRAAGFFAKISVFGSKAGTGNLGGFIVGATLGLVWTPCAGPVLGSVLTLIALQKDLVTAGILLCAYAVGAGIPMLIIAYTGQYLTTTIRSISRYTVSLQKIFGVVIILFALALYLNWDTAIYAVLLKAYPSFSPKF